MSHYQVLARKCRPQSFKEVIGQEAIVTTLKHAILFQRTAHAYLFCGSHGTGKTTLARLFAKVLNCAAPTEEGEPCNQCASCQEIASGQALDVLEIDGASHRGIEDIRQINETVHFVPSYGKYKIYLIDEVHMLTKEAFNAILKTLEEPPSHVKFFFATTEPHKIPATVLSRCQRFNLHRIPFEKIKEKLSAITNELGLVVEEEVFTTLAALSEGSLRDAESLLDQVIAGNDKEITHALVSTLLGLPSRELFFSLDERGSRGELAVAFEIAQEVFSSGKQIGFFLEELLGHFRTLFLLKQGVSLPLREGARYQNALSLYRKEQLIDILEMIAETQQSIRVALSEKTSLEMLLLRILRTHQKLSLDELVARLYALEARLSSPTQEKAEPPLPQEATPIAPPHPEKKESKKEERSASGRAPRKVVAPPAAPPPQEAAVGTEASPVHKETLLYFAAKELEGSLVLGESEPKKLIPSKKKE